MTPTALLLAALLPLAAGVHAPCTDASRSLAPGAVGDGYRELYESGERYEDFLARADQRVELWQGNTAKAEDLDAAVVERARAVGGSWHLLVVAVAGCSDSVSTIPYLARLASLVEGLELRIVDPDAGREVMEGHRTPDGRAATPTVLLLDAAFGVRGCFIERPRLLQEWILENRGTLSAEALFDVKMEWYAQDAGRETVGQVVGILEAAGRGEAVCAG